MGRTADWHPKKRLGQGLVVERDGQLGYAKSDSIEVEILAACLAQLVDVSVPRAEKGNVKGLEFSFAISHVHSCRSRPFATKQESTRKSYSQLESVALKKASGLLTFLPWISATDHNDDSNLVLDELSGGLFRVGAVDFEHAFRWPDGEESIAPYAPPALVNNRDPLLVQKHLALIEQLTPPQIALCVACSGLATQIANVLQRRQRLLRAALEKFQWLD